MSDTAAEPKGRTLPIAAIVVAGVSFYLYWKSFPDHVIVGFSLGIIGVLLGVVALLRARKGKTAGLVWAIVAIAISILSFGVLAAHLILFNLLFIAF